MTPQEFFEEGSMFTLDFLSEEEKETIYKIMELYALGETREQGELYRRVNFEDDFDLISNEGDKFVYLKKLSSPAPEGQDESKSRCKQCGYPVEKGTDYCGECLCEDDSNY